MKQFSVKLKRPGNELSCDNRFLIIGNKDEKNSSEQRSGIETVSTNLRHETGFSFFFYFFLFCQEFEPIMLTTGVKGTSCL